MKLAEGLLDRRLVRPLLGFLEQGLGARELAVCVALGSVIGVIPVLGSTTLLCLLASVSFRLNPAAIQIVNYVVYPVQLLLFVPFIKAGEWVFGGEALPWTAREIVSMVSADPAGAVLVLWDATLRALVVWTVLGALAAIALYAIALPLFSRAEARFRPARATEAAW